MRTATTPTKTQTHTLLQLKKYQFLDLLTIHPYSFAVKFVHLRFIYSNLKTVMRMFHQF
jgi:hypothetical protein